MEDSQIVELFWQRNEYAIAETKSKYGRYCYSIACNFLHNNKDSEEVVNDTYACAWNAIPPHKPAILQTFLGKITRQLSMKKLRERTAEKRGSGETCLVFDELEECIPAGCSIEEHIEAQEITQLINCFLDSLPVDERRVFICRYWYFDSISDISKRFGFGQSKVKTMLMRTRKKLLAQLKKEGIVL
jgi:RNA polymerase sigma-70 factor (ECF subfamily)